MSVVEVAGTRFSGVEIGTASGAGNGYVIGTTPVVEMLRVDNSANRVYLVGVKYSHHRRDEPSRGEREPDEYVRITMLVDGGPWRQCLWKRDTPHMIEVTLNEPGDFVAWEPGVWHQWWPQGPASMVTISFQRVAAEQCVGANAQDG